MPGSVQPIGRYKRDAGQHGDIGLPGTQEMILAEGGLGEAGCTVCRRLFGVGVRFLKGVRREVGQQQAAGQAARLGVLGQRSQPPGGFPSGGGVAAGHADVLGLEPRPQGRVDLGDFGDGAAVEHREGAAGVAGGAHDPGKLEGDLGAPPHISGVHSSACSSTGTPHRSWSARWPSPARTAPRPAAAAPGGSSTARRR